MVVARVRQRLWVAAFGVTFLMGAACTEEGPPSRNSSQDGAATTSTTIGAHGLWRPLAEPPLTVAPRAPAVWTGEELIIWGGSSARGEMLATGAAYDPDADKWTDLPPAPGPARQEHTAVWTGTEVVYWGGGGVDSPAAVDRGLAYNPATRQWRLIPEAPISVTARPNAAWVGEEMLVWGGMPSDPVDGDGTGEIAAYNPSRDAWRTLPAVPGGAGGQPFAVRGSSLAVVVTARQDSAGIASRVMSLDVTEAGWVESGAATPPHRPMPPSQEVVMGCGSGPAVATAALGDFAFAWIGPCFPERGYVYSFEADVWASTVDLPRMQAVRAIAGPDDIHLFGEVPTGVNVYRYIVQENVLLHMAHPGIDVVPGSQAVWTGTEVLFFNGTRGIDQPRPGAAFRPQPPFEPAT